MLPVYLVACVSQKLDRRARSYVRPQSPLRGRAEPLRLA